MTLQKSKSLLHIHLGGCIHITDRGVSAMVTGRPQLTAVHIPNSHITDESLKFIAQHCHDLTSLNIAHCKSIQLNSKLQLTLKKLQTLV
jgi:hypothetical protein